MDLQDSSNLVPTQFQPPCCRKGHLLLDQFAQSPVQAGLKHFQGWGIHRFSGFSCSSLLLEDVSACLHTEMKASFLWEKKGENCFLWMQRNPYFDPCLCSVCLVPHAIKTLLHVPKLDLTRGPLLKHQVAALTETCRCHWYPVLIWDNSSHLLLL